MIDMLASDGSEDDWVRRAQAGDGKAFSELVRRHQNRVYRYLLRMLGSHDDAMELTQDAFIKAWQALPQWQPETQFRTWLFRMGRRKFDPDDVETGRAYVEAYVALCPLRGAAMAGGNPRRHTPACRTPANTDAACQAPTESCNYGTIRQRSA